MWQWTLVEYARVVKGARDEKVAEIEVFKGTIDVVVEGAARIDGCADARVWGEFAIHVVIYGAVGVDDAIVVDGFGVVDVCFPRQTTAWVVGDCANWFVCKCAPVEDFVAILDGTRVGDGAIGVVDDVARQSCCTFAEDGARVEDIFGVYDIGGVVEETPGVDGEVAPVYDIIQVGDCASRVEGEIS